MADAPAPAVDLPRGTVTFLMSDIEGSTRLFHQLQAAYVPLLAEHRALLRDAVARHGGREVETEGDALLVAFADPSDAVAAALDGQRSLMAHSWPEGGEVRVRIGLHTGEATPEGRQYVSLAVHQVARVAAGAHGGQVLLSAATATAAEGRLPEDASVRSLGSFQLRGFPAPQRLFQLLHPDLPRDFPAPRALGVVAHNLPFLRTSLVGRDRERAALADLLGATGLVTVTGPGGVGKTRVAVQVAFDVMDRYADGAWVVELAPLTDPARVTSTVAGAVGVAEQEGRRLRDLLLEALAPKAMLLLLDNCEHLLDAVAGLVDDLVQHCPHLGVLVTSREPLEIDGEAVWRLAPLGTAGETTTGPSDAARLFAERAALVSPDFGLTPDNASDVERLVGRLDGIPLAIELAAAALVDRPLPAVLQGLTDRFTLLSRGRRTGPARHRTLQAALTWGLDLLTDEERQVFGRLAAFAGSGSVPAASAVCSGGSVPPAAVPAAVRRLIRASLLVAQPGPAERWSMLESVRELASLELTGAGEDESTAARHRAWYAARVEALAPDLGRADRPGAMQELTADHDNVRRALDTAVAATDTATGLRLGAAMAPFWTSRGHWTEGIDRLHAVLGLPGGDDVVRSRALVAVANLLLLRGDLTEASRRFDEGRARAAAAGDDVTLARALSGAGYIAFRRSDLPESQECWTQALAHAEAAGDERVAAGILRSLAVAAGSRGEQDLAGRLLDRAVASARRVGDDQQLRQLLGSAAERHLWLGAYRTAADEYGEALELASAIGDLPARPLLLTELGWVALLRGNVGLAHQLAAEAVQLGEEFVNRRVQVHALRLLGESLLRHGRPEDAEAALDRALTVAEVFGAPAELAGVLCSQATAALEAGRAQDACDLATRSLTLSGLPHVMRLVTPDWVRGAARLQVGELDGAARDFRASLAFAGGTAVRMTASGIWGLACVDAARGETARALTGQATALRLRSELGDRLGVAESLVAVAGLLASEAPEVAARLAGAAEALFRASAAVPTPRQQVDLDAVLRVAASSGDAGRVRAARADGAAMEESAAVEAALGQGAEVPSANGAA